MNYLMYRCEDSYKIYREDTGDYMEGWKNPDPASKQYKLPKHLWGQWAWVTDIF